MSTDSSDASPNEILQQVLAESNATEALPEALRASGREEPPSTREEMFAFLDGALEKALLGVVHPATASHVLATVRERLAGVDQSGTRPRSHVDDPVGEGLEDMPDTLPPPDDDSAAFHYDDLVSGAIHQRITPAWGVRIAAPDGHALVVWAVVSEDPELLAVAHRAAPRKVDVVTASSLAVLKGALNRGAESPSSAVVVDAQAPSIKLDRTFATLTEAADVRVILWRMSNEDRAGLIDEIPQAHAWLPCEAEVTPAEIMQLLGLDFVDVTGAPS